MLPQEKNSNAGDLHAVQYARRKGGPSHGGTTSCESVRTECQCERRYGCVLFARGLSAAMVRVRMCATERVGASVRMLDERQCECDCDRGLWM